LLVSLFCTYERDYPLNLPEIETPRLLLRGSLESDISDLFAVYSSPEVVRYIGDTIWSDSAEAEDFLSGAHEGLADEELFGWSIVLKDTGRVIGTCALFDCNLDQQVAEISYEIHPDYRGKRIDQRITAISFRFRVQHAGPKSS
jgi:ribosomal-protein-alanine N-acetyltransferase